MTTHQPHARRRPPPPDRRRPEETAAVPEPILDRALAFLTEDLEALDAAQLRATARCAPLWAARCGYALGYLEGSEDRQTLAADERHSLEHIVAGVRARLARALAGGPEGAPREVGVPQREGGR